MPAGLIKEDDGVRSEGDFGCDLVERELHGFAPSRLINRDCSAIAGCRKRRVQIAPEAQAIFFRRRRQGHQIVGTRSTMHFLDNRRARPPRSRALMYGLGSRPSPTAALGRSIILGRGYNSTRRHRLCPKNTPLSPKNRPLSVCKLPVT